MNTTSRLVTGISMTVIGTFLFIATAFWDEWIVSLIYGLIFFGLGIAILFNRKEDQIEQIKPQKGGNKK